MAAPNLAEIEWAIHELEHEESSKSGYIFLSALYNLREKLSGNSASPSAYSMQATPVKQEQLGEYGDSDFLRAVSGKDPIGAWSIIDELMETLQVVNRRAYDSVMRKLEKL